jgi:hypothetical protein
LLTVAVAAGTGCSGTGDSGSGNAPALLAAGDIAGCGTDGDEATARVVAGEDGIVAPLGDEAYEKGTAKQFGDCYAPTWGRVEGRTRPTPGNHEYETADATGYYRYFGAAAHPPDGYYSYDVHTWHVVVLNSNCPAIGGCGPGSRQLAWLRRDLAAHRQRCTLAYWHAPRFNSGTVHGEATDMIPAWRALYTSGADVVLNAHEHVYERFAPQTPGGRLDRSSGIRQFTVGTGGISHYRFGPPKPNSEVRNDDTFGVLRLRLARGRYEWRFLPAKGGTFSDSGSAACH